MMDLLLITISLVVVILALKQEKKVMNAPSSPLFLVTGFNMAILVLYFITSNWLGFHPLVFRTLTILLCGCFVFAIVSLFISSGLIGKRKRRDSPKLKYVDEYPSRTAIVLSIITIIFMVIKMTAIGVYNIIEDGDSAALFGAGGLSGHVLVLQIFLATHLIGRKFTIWSIVSTIGLIFCLFIYNVKAWIIIPFLLGWFIRRDLMGMKVDPLVLLLVPAGSLGVFMLSYMMTLGWNMDNMNFIWAHFCKYVYAGIGGLNEALSQNYPVGNAPFYGTPTFISIFFPIKVVIPSVYDYVVINDMNGEYTNVFSLFGGAYLFNGLLYGTLYIVIIALISYWLYVKRLRTENYWYYLSYYFWSSGLILSFFGNYYTLLNVWELSVEAFIVGVYFQRKTRTSHTVISIKYEI